MSGGPFLILMAMGYKTSVGLSASTSRFMALFGDDELVYDQVCISTNLISPLAEKEGRSVTLEFILKFLGVFLGVLARTLLPWLRKLREGQALRFNERYFYSTLGSLAIGFILTLVIFPQLTVANDGSPVVEAYFKLFCLAFGFGFGWNGMVATRALF
jgi:cytochrome c biogenesis factor